MKFFALTAIFALFTQANCVISPKPSGPQQPSNSHANPNVNPNPVNSNANTNPNPPITNVNVNPPLANINADPKEENLTSGKNLIKGSDNKVVGK